MLTVSINGERLQLTSALTIAELLSAYVARDQQPWQPVQSDHRSDHRSDHGQDYRRQQQADGNHSEGRRKRVAVAVNGQFVPRSQYAQARVKHDDKIDIVTAVGGG